MRNGRGGEGKSDEGGMGVLRKVREEEKVKEGVE